MQRQRREGTDSAPRTRTRSSPGNVDVIVLTTDSALLATLQEAAGVGHALYPASTIGASVELLLGGHCGIFIIDMAIVRSELARLTEKLQAQFPEVILLATGQRSEQNAVAGLVASGRIYRFLHKPISPARAELFLSAATRRYGELHQQDLRATKAARSVKLTRNRTLIAALLFGILAAGASWLFWPSAAVEPTLQPSPVVVSDIPDPKAAQLELLLSRAAAAYAANNVLPPTAGNAFDLYRNALQLDPENSIAQAGLDRMVSNTERQIATSLNARDASRAAAAIAALQKLEPTHPQLEAFQAQLTAIARRVRPAAGAAPLANPAVATPPLSPPLSPPTATSHLDLARTFLAANQLVEPIDANALNQLRLARNSGEDQSALQIAATDLGTRLLNRANVALIAGNLAETTKAYDAATTIDREFETSLPEIDTTGARIRRLAAAQGRSNAALDRLAIATKLRTSGKLIEPAGDNAFETLRQLLLEDAASPEIQNERQRLSFALLENTRTALAAGDIDRADVLTTRAEEILPGLPQTKALREQIGAARAERDDRNAILQAASLPRRRDVPAIYPRAALRSRTEGWVDLEFTIATDGTPADVTVKDSQPGQVFDSAATQALRQWRFEPIVRNGVAQSRRATLRVEFKLKN